MDRFLCGIYLWRWNLDGAMPFAYQQIAGPDPYGEGSGGERRHMLTYPSLRGPVSTVQWEACREGIYDLRYVATLQSWLDRAKWQVNRLIETGEGADSPRVQELMKAYAEEAAILDGIRDKVGLHPGQTLRSWSASSFDGLRDGITDAVVKLQQLVEGGQQPSLTP